MFLELSYALLHDDGRLGMIVPAGLYTDKGTLDLRTLFLEKSQWELLFGMINWNKIFESVYYRFKFCILIVQKGGTTTAVQAAFSRYFIQEWEEVEKYLTPYYIQQIKRFSPKTKTILETRTPRDLEILAEMYEDSLPLGDDGIKGWGLEYNREFDMTNDSNLFPPRPKWEEKGYQPDEYGNWLLGNWRPLNSNLSTLKYSNQVILSQDGRSMIQVDEIEDIGLINDFSPLFGGVFASFELCINPKPRLRNMRYSIRW